MATNKRRRLVVAVVGVVVVAVLAAVVGAYIYIHFIEGPRRPSSRCPTSSSTTSKSR